jgi:hypothetical protein
LQNKSVVKHIFFHDKMSYTSNPASFYTRGNLARSQGFVYPGSVNAQGNVNGQVNRNAQGAFVNRNVQGTSARNNYNAYGNTSASTCPCARGRR